MIQIHPQIREQFDTLLLQKNILKKHHADYRKWLRYYLDFCNKYHHDNLKKESLPPFIEKLRNKKKTTPQQRQAHHAVSIYYQIEGSNTIKEKTSEEVKRKNADWTIVFDKLNNQINIRHYSPKTLRAYKGWTRQFRSFTKSKDPRLLSAADLKDFLTFLAIKRKLSASSQNQAFNALLFFFRHVLNKEFGEIKDIPRAKKKRHIPVVLSREEIDAIISALALPYDGCVFR